MSRKAGSRQEAHHISGETDKTAYFDCFSGISGDMCLGAIVDAGVPLEEIERSLRKLPLRGYRLSQKEVLRCGIAATKIDVVLPDKGGSRKGGSGWEDIRKIILSSSLRDDIRQKGLGIFRILFDAEAKVHGQTLRGVHLHELGAVDCLVDVFGTLIGLDLLGVKNVYASPVNLGGGFVRTEHGILPVPAPATAEILRHAPVYPSGVPFELTTPTGAAILKYLAQGFGNAPAFAAEKIGSGAGARDLDYSPNILRLFIGRTFGSAPANAVTVIETNIDDMNPQAYEYLAEKLLRSGALDVSLAQTVMKKMRPAVTLIVLCERIVRDGLVNLILRETTSIGVRYFEASRVTMRREIRDVDTRYGKVRVKISSYGDIRKVTPEYEDCKTIAKKTGIALLEVMGEAREAALGGADQPRSSRGKRNEK